MNESDRIKLEVLEGNYWEHFKMAKDFALILSSDRPKMVRLYQAMDKLLKEIHSLKNNDLQRSERQ